MSRYAHVAFTENVRRVQEERGSAPAMDRLLGEDTGRPDPLGPVEGAFIGARDGFYLATVGDTGWPYVQFRGGPPGFVQVLGEHLLGYAEVRGNRQYITAGNIRANNRVSLFFMDYAHRTRMKVFGHAESHDPVAFPDLSERLGGVRTDGQTERLVTIRVEGFSWNCSKHITPRFSEEELTPVLGPVYQRLAELEEENRALRSQLEAQS
jgi:predicted pyridoxine 5'-phosphate oxidase superfamily flavin-nucleotide-binding protein